MLAWVIGVAYVVVVLVAAWLVQRWAGSSEAWD